MRTAVIVLTYLTLALVPPGVRAATLGPSPYLCFDAGATAGCGTADSPFAGGAFRYLHVEDLEDAVFDAPGVSLVGSAMVRLPGPGTDSVDADTGVVDGSGNGGHSLEVSGSSLELIFDAAALGGLPTHVGLVWTDGVAPSYVRLEAFDVGGQSLGTVVSAFTGDAGRDGGTAEDRFLGLIDPGGIYRVALLATPLSGPETGASFEIDHLQYGLPVPVPAALWLLASGLLALLGTGRGARAR